MKSPGMSTSFMLVALATSLVIAVAISPFTVATLLTLAIPSACLVWYEARQAPNSRADAKVGAAVILLTGTVGMACVAVFQGLLCYGAGMVLFRSQLGDYIREAEMQDKDITTPEHRAIRWEMITQWQYWVFLVWFCWVAAGGGEEFLKYIVLKFAVRQARPAQERHYYIYAVAATLGFSAVENAGFSYTSAKHESLRQFVLTVFTRVVGGSTAHALPAIIIADGMVRRDVHGEDLSVFSILALPVFFHGLFDFLMFNISAANGNVGWITPSDSFSWAMVIGTALSIMLTVARIAWQRLKDHRKQAIIQGWQCGSNLQSKNQS